jgi:hypothetical protein
MRIFPRSTHWALALSGLLTFSSVCEALTCGDDVDGRRVACACGNVVVSDTQLRPDDPVVVDRCERDGLFIRAASGTRTLVLDLNGQSLKGNGSGTGIRVLSGGSEGAVITGGPDGVTGQVVGFYVGIKSRGKTALKSLSGVTVESNVREGIVVDGVGSVVRDVESVNNGGDGVRVGGRGVVTRGIVSENNGGYGVKVRGRDTQVEARTGANGRGESTSSGRGHTIGVEVTR